MGANRRSEQQLIDESRASGRRLATAFHNGAVPQPIAVRMALQPGEFCAGQIPVHIYQWLEGDGSYVKRSGGWVIGGGVLGAMVSAVSVASNVAGNAARRASAARDAAGQWRHVETGTVYLTNRRWSIQGSTTWYDWWFNGIRMSDCDSKMIIFELAEVPRSAFVLPEPDYWYVMFHKLAYDEVVMPPPPSYDPGALPHAP